jgi:hypothetical protein
MSFENIILKPIIIIIIIIMLVLFTKCEIFYLRQLNKTYLTNDTGVFKMAN